MFRFHILFAVWVASTVIFVVAMKLGEVWLTRRMDPEGLEAFGFASRRPTWIIVVAAGLAMAILLGLLALLL